MIVAPANGRLLVVTQNDHAHFAGEMLALWRADGMPDHPRRRELLFAVREHDNGWREIDSAPMSDPQSGRPIDFTAISSETRWQVWRRGICRYAEREPYAALLIARHARHLHRARRSDPAWSEPLGEWLELESELAAATDASEAQIAGDYRWLELTDLLSLAACNRWTHELDCHGIRAALRKGDGGGEVDQLLIDPFPLAGTTTFRVACRWIPNRRFAGDADLGVGLATARWCQHAVQVVPGDDILGSE